MNQQVRARIINLVESHQGMKLTELASKLVTEFLVLSVEAILIEIEQMVMSGDIIEVEYNLPKMSYKTKSFLLPKGTYVEVK